MPLKLTTGKVYIALPYLIRRPAIKNMDFDPEKYNNEDKETFIRFQVIPSKSKEIHLKHKSIPVLRPNFESKKGLTFDLTRFT